MEIMNIGGTHFLGMNEDQKNIITSRGKFIDKFCKDKGWDKSNLSIQQVLEIRKQDGWQNPSV